MASTSSTSLTTAHQHAASADDYVAQGLFIPAAEEHTKAAEAFRACMEASSDEGTKRTLKMLYNEHTKAAKDLQRRIARLREDKRDPSLPQKSTRKEVPSVATNPIPPQPPASSEPYAPSRMTDSQQTVEDSFMVLGHSRTDQSDAFNHFWKITEGMLDYLSQPVAFATAPLSASMSKTGREGGSTSDTDVEDPISRNISRGINLVKAASSRILTRHDPSAAEGGRARPSTSSNMEANPDLSDDWDDDLAENVDDMADSFCMIRSETESSTSTLQKENATLKAELEEMRRQLASAEHMLKMRRDQDQQLRDSIILARKEAHRAMVSSTVVPRGANVIDPNTLNANVPPPVPPPVPTLDRSREREAQLTRRIRELEEEVRTVRAEQEKQKASIVRYRERWEKLKEASKKKKEAKEAKASKDAKASGHALSAIKERADEEPAAETTSEKDAETPRAHEE